MPTPLAPAATTETEQNLAVQVLRIDHKYGTDLSVHRTADSLTDTLHAYVTEWWADTAKNGADPDPQPTDPQQAIKAYFEALEGVEFYSTEETLIQG